MNKNNVIGFVSRDVYLRPPEKGACVWIIAYYTGPGGERTEHITMAKASDAYTDWWLRQSRDNGATWTAMKPLDGVVINTPKGGIVTYPQSIIVDIERNATYRFMMKRAFPGGKAFDFHNTPIREGVKPYYDHVYVSENDSSPILLKYEDARDPYSGEGFVEDRLAFNNAYFGVNPIIAKDGTVFFPITAVKEVPGKHENGLCLMRRNSENGEWLASNRVSVAPDISSRGLMEPSVELLNDGQLLVICRGNDTPATPGRKWFSVSSDGGKTLSDIQELTYNDGSRFYSPSSIHRLIRSAKTGKLYWFANIVEAAPKNNSPRYPLMVAEIDEDAIAVKKDNLTMIDTRQPNEPEILQLSNFCVLENRETLDLEIYMPRWGENPDNKWDAPCCRYILGL